MGAHGGEGAGHLYEGGASGGSAIERSENLPGSRAPGAPDSKGPEGQSALSGGSVGRWGPQVVWSHARRRLPAGFEGGHHRSPGAGTRCIAGPRAPAPPQGPRPPARDAELKPGSRIEIVSQSFRSTRALNSCNPCHCVDESFIRAWTPPSTCSTWVA